MHDNLWERVNDSSCVSAAPGLDVDRYRYLDGGRGCMEGGKANTWSQSCRSAVKPGPPRSRDTWTTLHVQRGGTLCFFPLFMSETPGRLRGSEKFRVELRF